MTADPTNRRPDRLRVAVAQIAPVFLDRRATLERVIACVEESARQGAELVVFGEALVPGYPVWLSRSDGARFESRLQKELFALYAEQAVDPTAGHLEPLRAAAQRLGVAVVLGLVERAPDRGGHSLYCAAAHVSASGELAPLHRKLVPTYEERLVWGHGDGAGLRVHGCGPFRLGVLNCWENWMPLARAALQHQGEDLHLALWPGALRNTEGITRHLAREGRSFAVSVSGLLRGSDVPRGVPGRDLWAPDATEVLCDGGSVVVGPDGRDLFEPVVGREALITVELDLRRVREERQNFDPVGHYARPDVLRLVLDTKRQGGLETRA